MVKFEKREKHTRNEGSAIACIPYFTTKTDGLKCVTSSVFEHAQNATTNFYVQ